MKDKLKRELLKAAVLTFEELGFMFPNEDIYESQKHAHISKRVRVHFNGLFSGCLEMSIYGDLLPLIASNMLGEEGIPAEFQQQDALGELINVICGNMLPGITSPKEVFTVGVPQYVDTKSQVDERGEVSVSVELGIDEGRAELKLYLNEDAEQYFKEQNQ